MDAPTPTFSRSSALDRRFLLGGLTGLAGASALAAMARTAHAGAGPLNPPAGPVTATPGPEPRIAVNATNTPANAIALYFITQPGSYYLTRNVTGQTGKIGIMIDADNVTLDLNGFALIGVPGSDDGIGTGNAQPHSGTTVLNGVVRNWGGCGIQLRHSQFNECRIHGVTAVGNADSGIAVHGQSHITDCVSIGNGSGIKADLSCTIERCTTVANTAEGIVVTDSCAVRNCAAHRNAAAGISATAACTIADCSCLANGSDGIVAAYRNTLIGNQCVANGATTSNGAGVHILTSAGAACNHIEGNTCGDGDRGYFIESAGNILMRNVSFANALHWSVAAGNFGQVVSAAASGAYIGNAGGTPLAATGYDPNANFTI